MRHMLRSTIAAAMLAASATAAFAAEKVTYLFPAPDFLPAFAPFQLAKSKGYFDEARLEVTFQVTRQGRSRDAPGTLQVGRSRDVPGTLQVRR